MTKIKSKFERNLEREFKENEESRKKIILKALSHIESKKGKPIAWELFMKFYSPTDLTNKIYHDQFNRFCEDYSVSTYEHMTIYRALVFWRVCGFLDVQVKIRPKNRFDKTYRLNINFFIYYLKYNFGISLNKNEIKFLNKLFGNDELKEFLYKLYSYKDLKFNRNRGINFRYDLCRTFIKVIVGFMQSTVNHKFETADYYYEIQTFNPRLMKKWGTKINDILNNSYKEYEEPKPYITVYKKISNYWLKNKVY